jgi:hypothetical protein
MTEDASAAAAVDADEAARILGVGLEQVDAMVEEGLLSPLSGPGERRFAANEVHAVRVQGG